MRLASGITTILLLLISSPPAFARTGKPLYAAETGRLAPTQLVSGVPVTFSLPSAASPTLYTGDYGYTIDVPAGASRLEVRVTTTTPNADIDLFVRWGQSPAVSGGQVLADHRSEGLTGNEAIVADATTNPPLRAGRYYIALANFTVNVAATGSIVATVGGGAPSGDLRLTINQIDTSNCPQNRVIVSVTDSQGQPVTGLSGANFVLTENGQQRSITVSCGAGTGGTAASVAVVIDTSTSLTQADLDNEKSAAKQLISQLGPGDSVGVWAFGSSVQRMIDFTTDRAAANAAVDRITRGGSTALYRAIVDSAQALATRTGRKAIVLMTDGQDTVGGATIDSAIAQAQQAGAPVFTVGFGSGISTTVLTRIANETGGFFSQSATSVDLQRILQSIGQVLSSQCEIIYTSTSISTTNSVSVTVNVAGRSATATRSVPPCTAGASATLILEDSSGVPGGTVAVPLTLNATGTQPAAFQIDVTFDRSLLTFVNVRNGDRIIAAGKDVASNVLANGNVRLVGAGLNQNPIANGSLATLNFTMSPAFPANGTTIVGCLGPQTVNAQSQQLPTTCRPATIRASSRCTCDVNRDGFENVADVQLIINMVLGVAPGFCDLNGDGAQNVADVQIVINAALGLGCRMN